MIEDLYRPVLAEARRLWCSWWWYALYMQTWHGIPMYYRLKRGQQP